MTSNVGAQLLQRDTIDRLPRRRADEAAQATADYDRMKEKVLGELKNTFRPEFLNRIDATVVFRQLSREQIREIVDLLLARVKAQLAGQQMELVVTDAAKDAIIAKGYDQAYGARPLRREIQNQIEDPLAERMLQASFEAGRHDRRRRRRGRDAHDRASQHRRQARRPPRRAAKPAIHGAR